jgi:hypothetical protein
MNRAHDSTKGLAHDDIYEHSLLRYEINKEVLIDGAMRPLPIGCLLPRCQESKMA